MNRNKMKSRLALLMVFILLFAGLGTSAFADKPPAELATIELVGSQTLTVESDSNSVQATLIVTNQKRKTSPEVSLSAPAGSSLDLELVKARGTESTYSMTYTKPVGFTEAAEASVTVLVINNDNVETEKTIDIVIEAESTQQNEPPLMENPPYISGDFVVGEYVTAFLGTWSDDSGIEPTVVGTWELTKGAEHQTYSVEGSLYLEPEWEGWSLQLKVVATDDEGASSEESTTPELITSPANQPPTLVSDPDITGTFETGTYATPIFGEWEDLDSDGFTVISTWELTYNTEHLSILVEGSLYLEQEWEGWNIQLKEVATDSDGASNEASSTPELISAPPTENLLYVALGDSIATGTVAPSMPNETPYIHAFRSHVATETGRTVDMSDFSEDGDQTGHLLARLGGPSYDGVGADQTMINQVRAADVITVSIGGNNLMSAAKYTTYVFFFIRVDYYDFDRIDTDKADAGREAVVEHFPLIIDKIREYNATAKIVVNDLYNPFNKSSDEDNYNLVDGYFFNSNDTGVNDVIRGVCESADNVEYAAVYEAFEGYGNGDKKEQITYMYIQDTYFGFELRNPHPNTMGQSLIETAVENAYDRIPIE